MTPTITPLVQSFSLRQLELANRIVMAPMTRGFSPGGVPGEDVASYYRRKAQAGTGLIIAEGAGVDHPAALGGSSVDGDNAPHMYGVDALEGWRRVVEQVHAAGGVTPSGTLVLSRTENAGKARIRGAEVEITLTPREGLRFGASGSVTNTKYTKLNPGATATLIDVFLGAPKYTYGLTGDYRIPMTGGSVALHADGSWRGRVFQSQDCTASTDPYGQINARVTFDVDAAKGFEFALWSRNLTERKYYTRSLDFTAGIYRVIIGFPGDPRTYGASVSYAL